MAKKSAEKPVQKKRQIDFQWLNIDLVVPNDYNVNEQDEATFSLLKDEIAQVGLIDPIEVVPMEDGTFQIIGGEHRWRAAKELGHEEVPCVLLTDAKWAELDLRKFVSVRMNVLKGKLNPEKFLALHKEMARKYGEEPLQKLMGFADAKAFQRQLGWVKKSLKAALPKEMAAEVEAAAKDAKSVEDLSNVVQDLYQKFGETLQHSYMIFTYGKQSHIFVQMSAPTRNAMNRVMDACRVLNWDINEFMKPVIEAALKDASIELEKKSQQDAVGAPDPVAPKKLDW